MLNRVLVPIKRVVDYAVKIRVRADKLGIETNNVKMSMNPFDEIAVEEAIRLREKGIVKEIVTVSVGPKSVLETIRYSLAMGADRGIHIDTTSDTDTDLEPIYIAQILKKLIEKENSSLVVMGKQAIDDDCNQTGQMLAGMLNWPQCTAISKIEIQPNTNNATFIRETDSGLETLFLQLPAIVTCDLRLNEPRYAKLQNIMKVRNAFIQPFTPTDLGVKISRHTETIEVNEPSKRTGGVKVQSAQEVVEKLKKLGVI